MTRRLVSWLPLTIGALLFAAAVTHVDRRALAELSGRLGFATLLVILINGLSQLLRTLTWRWCLPPDVRISFWRLLRLRLAGEAFGYVTISGIASDPMKVMLLRGEVPTAAATASVVLERLSYVIVTFALVGAWAAVTLVTTPLPPVLRQVFFWFAVGSGIVTTLAACAVTGNGTYMSRFMVWLTRVTRGVLGTHAFGRLLVHAERHILEFARADRRRVALVVAGDAVNYALMAAEVVVVLRAIGVASGVADALTIETFTRVMSVAAAPIPGGLGALEASHVVVASALGVPTAGAALALARRIRGLFWAGIGFAVYPRPRAPRIDTAVGASGGSGGRTLLYIVDDPAVTVPPTTLLCGLPLAERVLRPAARDGYERVIAWAPRSSADVRAIARRLGQDAPLVEIAATAQEWAQLLASVPAPGVCDRVEAGAILRPALRVTSAADVPGAEQALRRSVFKPSDGVVARFNRRISLPISLVLIRTPITANQISLAIVALGLWAAWLFSLGSYAAGVSAAALSLTASILDGCDGEIARLKYQESAFGCWLETVGDYAYYVAIFIGLTIGAVRATGDPMFYQVGIAALAGAVVAALLLLLLRRRLSGNRPEQFGAAARAHLTAPGGWRAKYLARLARCATRAVMPYGILALALVNLAPAVIVLAAIGANLYWVVMMARFRVWLTPGGAAMVRVVEP